MTKITPELLNELEALEQAATPGEWVENLSGTDIASVHAHGKAMAFVRYDLDATFIAASRNALPVLIQEVRRLWLKCGEYAPEGTEIFHVWPSEFVLCPTCQEEINDPWYEPSVTCDEEHDGNWHGVIECPKCSAKIEVHSNSTHFWTAQLATKLAVLEEPCTK